MKLENSKAIFQVLTGQTTKCIQFDCSLAETSFIVEHVFPIRKLNLT